MGFKRLTHCTLILLILISSYTAVNCGVVQTIRELLQNNVAGEPITHKKTVWDFDPEIAEKRRELYYEQHGFRGAKFIERIGVGIDGKQDERRAFQQQRDVGRLNGEHFINFP